MVWSKHKGFWYLWFMVLVFLGFFLIWIDARTAQTQEESSCVSCHTNSRELIKLSQIIQKMRPPIKSEEIKGEG